MDCFFVVFHVCVCVCVCVCLGSVCCVNSQLWVMKIVSQTPVTVSSHIRKALFSLFAKGETVSGYKVKLSQLEYNRKERERKAQSHVHTSEENVKRVTFCSLPSHISLFFLTQLYKNLSHASWLTRHWYTQDQ